MILDLIALDPSSRVWIYQAHKELTYDQLDESRERIEAFLGQWTSHNHDLHCYGNIFHKKFLALFVDQSQSSMASGCSIDSSVRFVQELGQYLEVDFFNRTLFSYFANEEDIKTLSQEAFVKAFQDGEITNKSLVFDHLVDTKERFLKEWIRPLEETWLKRLV